MSRKLTTKKIPMKTPTAGTWIAKDGQIYTEETGKTLAVIPHFDSEPEQIANQKLMAAAPELLKALSYAVKFIKSCPKLKDPERRPKGLENWENLTNEINN